MKFSTTPPEWSICVSVPTPPPKKKPRLLEEPLSSEVVSTSAKRPPPNPDPGAWIALLEKGQLYKTVSFAEGVFCLEIRQFAQIRQLLKCHIVMMLGLKTYVHRGYTSRIQRHLKSRVPILHINSDIWPTHIMFHEMLIHKRKNTKTNTSDHQAIYDF